MNEIRFIDLFSGVGGIRLGLERASFTLDPRKNREGKENSKEEHGYRGRYNSLGRDEVHSKEGSKTEWSTDGGSKGQSTPSNSQLERATKNTRSESDIQRRWNSDTRGTQNLRPKGDKSRDEKHGTHFRHVWSNDFNKYANQIYTKNFGEEDHHPDDIRGVNPEDIPDFDILCAGFPCQSFSVAGKRKGFEDTRGTLFFEICRIVETKRPSLLLLENVKGLLNHDRGRTFTVILQALDELGYWVEWQVLNSKYFGVPQNRERVFIIGHLRGAGGREVFPIGENGKIAHETEKKINGKNSLSLTEENAGGWNARGTYIGTPKNAGALTGGGHSGGLHSDMTLIKVGNISQAGHDSLWGRVYDPKGLAMNLNAEGGGVGAKTGLYTVPVLTPGRPNKRQHGRRFKEDGDPSFTLTGQDIHGIMTVDVIPEAERPEGNYLPRERVISDKGVSRAVSTSENQAPWYKTNFRIRRLTPMECERLQGFPDNWTKWGYQKGGIVEYEDIYGYKTVELEELDYYGEPQERKIWTVIDRKKLDIPLEDTVQISDTQRYKCLGNAVTVNVIEFLGNEILQSLR